MQNELYHISNWQQEAGRFTCDVHYNAGHEIFTGHFPGQPVVPGVCTMDMVKELLQRALNKKLILRSTGQVKFLRLILPDVQPQVTVSWQETEMGYQVAAALKAADADLFKMNAAFEVYPE